MAKAVELVSWTEAQEELMRLSWENFENHLCREFWFGVFNSCLTRREKDVLECRYGFVDGAWKPLEQVASIFNLTRERIRQIEMKAVRKIRWWWKYPHYQPKDKPPPKPDLLDKVCSTWFKIPVYRIEREGDGWCGRDFDVFFAVRDQSKPNFRGLVVSLKKYYTDLEILDSLKRIIPQVRVMYKHHKEEAQERIKMEYEEREKERIRLKQWEEERRRIRGW